MSLKQTEAKFALDGYSHQTVYDKLNHYWNINVDFPDGVIGIKIICWPNHTKRFDVYHIHDSTVLVEYAFERDGRVRYSTFSVSPPEGLDRVKQTIEEMLEVVK